MKAFFFIYLFHFSSLSLDTAERQSLVAAQVGVANVKPISKTAGWTPEPEVCVLNSRGLSTAETHLKSGGKLKVKSLLRLVERPC